MGHPGPSDTGIVTQLKTHARVVSSSVTIDLLETLRKETKMGTTPPPPSKDALPKELFDAVTTLTPEAQNAALRKAKELRFDLQRGRIPLEETLINLNSARETLLDAVEKNKLPQLPLKLQYALLAQTQRVSQQLVSLLNGSDTVLALEDSVDDLTSSIWQYNLQNLSGEVLGFTQKMNQLKAQEALIRQAHREAEAFSAKGTQAEAILTRLGEIDSKAQELSEATSGASTKAGSVLREITQQADEAKLRLSEVEQTQASAAASLAACEELAGKISTLAGATEQTKASIAETDVDLKGLLKQFSTDLEEAKARTETLIEEHRKNYADTAAATKEEVERLTTELTDSITTSQQKTTSELSVATVGLDNSVRQVRTELSDLVANTDTRLKATEDSYTRALQQALETFGKEGELKLAEVGAGFTKKATEIEVEARNSVENNDAELHRLTTELGKLESRIRDSIERATGYGLFHSFQTRQEALARAKRFWGWALAVAVAISLIASGWFIYSLRYVHVYNAAFYLKLSISLPIIYAIAFCNLQYSRERRLEEEYAFKSNISISLDPYQRLVRGLVSEDKPEEIAKYTAFVIDSVNRVFTSPTEHIFDEHRRGKSTSPEKLLKGLRELLEPILAVIKK